MTEEEREELIEKMAKAVVENPPDDGRNWITKWHKYSESDKKICRAAARAALAVAEPVIRGQCAKKCELLGRQKS